MIPIKIINRSNNDLPKYETEGSAGMDIRAFLVEEVVIKPFERVIVPTGLFLEIPTGYEVQLRPRSGLAIKYGITLPNAPATIDSDYRGELMVALINLSQENFIIKGGDRMAQMIVAQHEKVSWDLSDELKQSDRGDKGFGSTGIH